MPGPHEDGQRLILGIGTDLIDIRRVERTLARFGARFRERVFTEIEQARAERAANPAAAYAKRYAAKEACAKALGTGFRRGVYWRDIGVVNRGSGMPVLELRHGAAARLAALTPPGMVPQIDLSLTDEPPFAHGMVVISAAAPSEASPLQEPSRGPAS
jgi:holo-[acyl-carrier protein] synthase